MTEQQKTLDELCKFSVVVKDLTLYHGSGIPGIKLFMPAQSYTFGKGMYLTSEASKAEGYARWRAYREYSGELDPMEGYQIPDKFTPTVYVFTIPDAKLLDLRTQESLDTLFPHWQAYLRTNRDKLLATVKEQMRLHVAYDISKKITEKPASINRNSFIGNQGPLNRFFSQFLQELGYDGLIAIEGGEGNNGFEIGKHDSYVIFDSKKPRLDSEYAVSPMPSEERN